MLPDKLETVDCFEDLSPGLGLYFRFLVRFVESVCIFFRFGFQNAYLTFTEIFDNCFGGHDIVLNSEFASFFCWWK
jgi:hypothetical protein